MLSYHQNLDLALQIFRYAGEHHPGFRHTYQTYLAIIRRLARSRAFSAVEPLLSDLRRSGIVCHEHLFITVIRSYGLAGDPERALRTFVEMERFRGVHRTVRSLNCVLLALVQNEKHEMVKWVFGGCQSRFRVAPNVVTGNILIKAFCEKGDLEGAHKVLDEMPSMGMVPNVVTYTTIVGGFVSRGDMDGAERAFAEILDRGWVPDATAYTILMDGYIKNGRFSDAIRVMDEMEENKVPPNHVTYSVMILAYCKENKPGEALGLFEDMLRTGANSDAPSPALTCKLIDVLCENGKVEEACFLYKGLLRGRCTADNAIASTLVHWLCKTGKTTEARVLFDELAKGSRPSLLTCNTLVAGMCEAGELSEAARVWDEMVSFGLRPNSFTYSSLIAGFCGIGKPEEGIGVLEEMAANRCGPNKATYEKLIEGLCEAGKKREVKRVLFVAMSSGYVNEESWDYFFARFLGKLDNGVTVLEEVLAEDVSLSKDLAK